MIINVNDEIEGYTNNNISINIISKKNIKSQIDRKNNQYNIFALLNNKNLMKIIKKYYYS